MMRAIPIAVVSMTLTGCVTREIKVPEGLGSFNVEIAAITPLGNPDPNCAGVGGVGTPWCPRPFATASGPIQATIVARALDRKGQPLAWDGTVYIDVRPGRLVNVGPEGKIIQVIGGMAQADIEFAYATGQTHIWVEDCGTSSVAGSFATGISAPITIDRPTLAQINETLNNTTSAMEPKPTNACGITGDPRYGIRVGESGEREYLGYSGDGLFRAPPPAIGNYVEVVGCSRAEWIANGTCARGPLVVTATGNEGFFVSDINPANTGFEHLYAFTFRFPDGLQVGDVLLSLRGSPVEFAGATQFSNPSWTRDEELSQTDILPTPVRISPALYESQLRTYGRNDADKVELEKLEGALVCFDGLAPSALVRDCDANGSRSIDRQGCLVSFGSPLPPVCAVGAGQAARPPTCDSRSIAPYCFPFSQEELDACALTGYIPENPTEYCCERACYEDVNCTEGSAYTYFGQWVADVYGKYELGVGESAAKVAVISRDAHPDFGPIAFGAGELSKAPSERRRLMVVGNLRHVIAARPAWVLVPRSPNDIVIDGSCP